MTKAKKELLTIPSERIASKIFWIRNKKVMIDRDIAELYRVKTGALNQAVKRNIDRFPTDFMFQLTKEETEIWKSQIVISKAEKKGLRKKPLDFTEQGIAMLSSVLKSKRAIQVNVQIIRTFIKLRELLATNEELQRKIARIEQKYDKRFRVIFEAIKKLIAEEEKPKKQIGFKIEKD